MLYFILRPLTRIALKVYFRRITINGLQHLPRNKPIIICSNHPTGFIEPCLLACFLPRTLHFLVRGDLFEKPLLKRILVSTNQIPIYRFRDGYEKLRNNAKVLNISYEKLSEGKAILIFPEASTKEVKYLRPIQKGAARMAIEAKKQFPKIDLEIIPIGINYSAPNKWRSYVNINIGPAISPELPVEDDQLRETITALTTEIKGSLSDQLLMLNDAVSEELLNKSLVVGQWVMPVNSSLTLRKEEPGKYLHDRKISESVHSSSNLTFLPDELVTKEVGEKYENLELYLCYLLTVPLSLIFLLNAPPILFGIYMRNKYVREREFLASVTIAASLGAYIILLTLAFFTLLFISRWKAFFIFLIPLAGFLSLPIYDYCRSVFKRFKLKRKFGEEKLNQIKLQGLEYLNENIKKKL